MVREARLAFVRYVNALFGNAAETLAVADFGSGFWAPPAVRESALFSQSGRGLAIVSTLADTLEIECPEPAGCCVRARLDHRRP